MSQEWKAHTYPKHVWDTAETKFKEEVMGQQQKGSTGEGSTVKASVAAGRYLFSHLFTDEEKAKCTIKGKKGEWKLSEERVNAILGSN